MEENISDGGSLQERIRAFFPGKQQDIRAYSTLTLAYVGDAI